MLRNLKYLFLIYVLFVFRINLIMRNYKKIEITDSIDGNEQGIVQVNFSCIF